MSEKSGEGHPALRPGELAFTILITLVAAILLSQIGEQTKFYKRLKLPTQPGFWPALSLGGMVLSGVILSITGWLKRRRSAPAGSDLEEIVFIGRAVEFMLWFMVYVWLTPWIGYLAATILFIMCLAWRAGYRSLPVQGLCAGLGLFVVLLFKSFLSVKIPGGEVYTLLPQGLQTFMMVNF